MTRELAQREYERALSRALALDEISVDGNELLGHRPGVCLDEGQHLGGEGQGRGRQEGALLSKDRRDNTRPL